MNEEKMINRLEKFYDNIGFSMDRKIMAIVWALVDGCFSFSLMFCVLDETDLRKIIFVTLYGIYLIVFCSYCKVKYLDFNQLNKKSKNIFKYLPIDKKTFKKFYLKKELKYNIIALIWRLPVGIILLVYGNEKIYSILFCCIIIIIMPIIGSHTKIRIFEKACY